MPNIVRKRWQARDEGQHGNDKGSRFSGTCRLDEHKLSPQEKERTRFSYADDVTVLQANWDCLPLNGRRFLVTDLLNAV